MKKNNGITLIALVITIIVMLILVAVTITIAVNGGLFNYARKAAVDTNTRIAEEQEYANLGNYEDYGYSKDYEYLISKYSPTKWTYTDSDGDGTINVGDVLKVGNESFYVIATDSTTVTLLAALNVETDPESENCNKQTNDASPVAFDSTYPYSLEYDDSTIKPLVEDYVDYLKTLGVTIQEGRLMSFEEIIDLGADEGSWNLSDCPAFIRAKNFWLGSEMPGGGYVLCSEGFGVIGTDPNYLYGMRPVIVISKSDIK